MKWGGEGPISLFLSSKVVIGDPFVARWVPRRIAARPGQSRQLGLLQVGVFLQSRPVSILPSAAAIAFAIAAAIDG